jgi:hypothetical protein
MLSCVTEGDLIQSFEPCIFERPIVGMPGEKVAEV